ncbi:MAG: hypothetical protein JNL72_13980 [Flavipsychrobacter sp.]|nr:hypothetical protein [Flavipsychrobacter sp.]
MHAQTSPTERNENISLVEKLGGRNPEAWVPETTAIFIVHGIGNQKPLETIDEFSRTLVHTYKKYLGYDNITVEHKLKPKSADSGSREWYDNFLRIRMKGSEHYIDLYEYYWAHHTEGMADWEDINQWLSGVTKGAEKFYKKNSKLSVTFETNGPLVSKWKYKFFIGFVSRIFLFWRSILRGLSSLFSRVPLIGGLLSNNLNSVTESTGRTLSNIVGDMVAYTVTDAKNKYYPVRRAILDGAVNGIKDLMEEGVLDDSGEPVKGGARTYPRIIVGGHSLGSVVSFDAINRINLMVNSCLLKTYDGAGFCKVVCDENAKGKTVCDQMKGYFTFGSPLDKVAFFLRENIPDTQYVRQQLLNHMMNFKQRNWSLSLQEEYGYFEIENKDAKRLLDDMKWTNYYDQHDYVSGDLDFYAPLTNVNCNFKGNIFSFTHSDYWDHEDFYKDIILTHLS